MNSQVGGQAARMLFYSGAALLAMLLSACGARPGPSEQRLNHAWFAVQAEFDRLATFELDFRVAAAAAARKTEAERLTFIRDALDRRSQLQIGLKRELSRFTRTAASEPRSARVANIKKLQREMDKLMALQAGSGPSVKALALEKFDGELRAYQAHLDAELRSAK